jgi:hypothetical protein
MDLVLRTALHFVIELLAKELCMSVIASTWKVLMTVLYSIKIK